MHLYIFMFQVALKKSCSCFVPFVNVLFPAVKNKRFIKEYDLNFLFHKKDRKAPINSEGNSASQKN